MGWMTSFPYKWQVLEITLGLVNLVSASVFFLISRGLMSPLWIILAATFLCIGAICTLTGAIWCYWSVKEVHREHNVYGKFKDCETETLTCVTVDNNRM